MGAKDKRRAPSGCGCVRRGLRLGWQHCETMRTLAIDVDVATAAWKRDKTPESSARLESASRIGLAHLNAAAGHR